MKFINEYWDLISGAIGFLLGSGVTLTFQRLRQGSNANFADQNRSTVGGDQAGRDIKK